MCGQVPVGRGRWVVCARRPLFRSPRTCALRCGLACATVRTARPDADPETSPESTSVTRGKPSAGKYLVSQVPRIDHNHT